MTRTKVIDQAISEIAKNNKKEEYEVTALEVTNFLAEQITDQSERLLAGWHSVEDRPLFTKDERGRWVCTEDGDGDFIAAVETNEGWWTRHCVVEDEIGLCVVGDDYNEPAGWSLEDVTHWKPMWSPPPRR